jgi:hypothetical protein
VQNKGHVRGQLAACCTRERGLENPQAFLEHRRKALLLQGTGGGQLIVLLHGQSGVQPIVLCSGQGGGQHIAAFQLFRAISSRHQQESFSLLLTAIGAIQNTRCIL